MWAALLTLRAGIVCHPGRVERGRQLATEEVVARSVAVHGGHVQTFSRPAVVLLLKGQGEAVFLAWKVPGI